MKILIIYGHPNFNDSIFTKGIINEIKKEHSEWDILSIDKLLEENNWKLDIQKEQKRLLNYDIIIFQSPIFWYDIVPSLSHYFNTIFSAGWAYGKDSKLAMQNKKFILSTTSGAPKEAYNKENISAQPLQNYLYRFEIAINRWFNAKYLGDLNLYQANPFNKNQEEINNSFKDHIKQLEILINKS